VNSKGKPIVQRHKKPEYETEYSTDSQGEVKQDRNGNPVKRYERDPDTGRVKKNSKGEKVPKKRRVKPVSESEETVYSEDS